MKILNFFKLSIIIFCISIFTVEILMRIFFGPPIRMQYDFTLTRLNSQSDFIVEYKYDFKNGHRDFDLKCDKEEEKILIIGDSFGFAQGVEVKNTLTKLLDKDYCIENWSMIGKDLKFIKHNLFQKNISDFKKVIIIFFDNDTQVGYDPDKLKYAKIREFLNYNSYSYNFLKIFRKFINDIYINNNVIFIDGRLNNPATLLNTNSMALKIWFDLESNFKIIDSELNKIIKNINKKVPELILFVIPEPSVCSREHREFYSLYNAEWLPEFNKRSSFDIYVENSCNQGNCKYLPIYKNICDNQIRDGNLYFKRDFHLNENGQFFLYETLIEYLN